MNNEEVKEWFEIADRSSVYLPLEKLVEPQNDFFYFFAGN